VRFADLGRVETTYSDYQSTKRCTAWPPRSVLNGDQRFLLAYAQGRQAMLSEGEAARANRSAVSALLPGQRHRPKRRCMIHVVGVKPGDALHLAPTDRVRIW
jgi:putative endopeptidase